MARILIYYLLSNEFEEFIFISDSISDAIEAYQEIKKQVFFFDDFPDRNFHEIKPKMNEEIKLLKFIKKVKAPGNKAFIITTRDSKRPPCFPFLS